MVERVFGMSRLDTERADWEDGTGRCCSKNEMLEMEIGEPMAEGATDA